MNGIPAMRSRLATGSRNHCVSSLLERFKGALYPVPMTPIHYM